MNQQGSHQFLMEESWLESLKVEIRPWTTWSVRYGSRTMRPRYAAQYTTFMSTMPLLMVAARFKDSCQFAIFRVIVTFTAFTTEILLPGDRHRRSKAYQYHIQTVILPCKWFVEEPSQFSVGQTAQSLTCSIMEKPHTGLDDWSEYDTLVL